MKKETYSLISHLIPSTLFLFLIIKIGPLGSYVHKYILWCHPVIHYPYSSKNLLSVVELKYLSTKLRVSIILRYVQLYGIGVKLALYVIKMIYYFINNDDKCPLINWRIFPCFFKLSANEIILITMMFL